MMKDQIIDCIWWIAWLLFKSDAKVSWLPFDVLLQFNPMTAFNFQQVPLYNLCPILLWQNYWQWTGKNNWAGRHISMAGAIKAMATHQQIWILHQQCIIVWQCTTTPLCFSFTSLCFPSLPLSSPLGRSLRTRWTSWSLWSPCWSSTRWMLHSSPSSRRRSGTCRPCWQPSRRS